MITGKLSNVSYEQVAELYELSDYRQRMPDRLSLELIINRVEPHRCTQNEQS